MKRLHAPLLTALCACLAMAGAPLASADDGASGARGPRVGERARPAQGEARPREGRLEERRSTRAERRADVSDDPVELSAKREALAAEIAQIERTVEKLREKQRYLEVAREAIDNDRPIEEIRDALRAVPVSINPAPFQDGMALSKFGERRHHPAPERAGGEGEPPQVDMERFEAYLQILKRHDPEAYERVQTFREQRPEHFMRVISERRGKWMAIIEQAERNPAVAELLVRRDTLDWPIKRAARRVIIAASEGERRGAQRELRALIAEQFEISLSLSQLHFAEAAKVVQQLAAELDEQKANAAEMIDERAEAVIADQSEDRERWEARFIEMEQAAQGQAQAPKPSPKRVR